MVKIQFVDVPYGFNTRNNFLIDVINRNFGGYEISNTPDFLFFSYNGTEHYKFNTCVKIFFTDEAVTPDFNQCDYAIGYDELEFGDRYCKYNEEKTGEPLEHFIVRIINKGNTPYEKDALGLAKKMSIPDLSSKELVEQLVWKIKCRLRKK